MSKPKKHAFEEFYKEEIEGEPLDYKSCELLFKANDGYIEQLEKENEKLRDLLSKCFKFIKDTEDFTL